MDDELRFHMDAYAADLMREGVPRAEAMRRARLEFGGMERVREECRESRGVNLGESIRQDARFALRMLRKSPGFTVVVILTLALGIGANTAIFGLVNAVLLRPLPYPNASRLMHVGWLWKSGGVPSVSGEQYAFWAQHSSAFESAAAYDLFAKGFNLSSGSERPEYIKAWRVSRDFFRTLGVEPFLGRGFTVEEDRPGGPNALILSYALWQSRFGADRGIIGREIALDGQNFSVAGVMPKGFGFSLPYAATSGIQIWVPLRLVPDPRDGGHDYLMVARLKRGVSYAQAQADMQQVLAEIREAVPGQVGPGDRGVLLMPYQKWLTGDVRAPLMVLMFAVGLVLLIATGNVANLLIARATTRRPEMAVRLALGATSGRLRRQLVTESLLVSLSGGAAALVLAPWTIRLLIAMSPEELPFAARAQADSGVLVFTLVTAALAGIVAGLAPSFRVRRVELSAVLKEGGRTSSAGVEHRRVRIWLVGGEVALSTLLLCGALLLSFSFMALERVSAGFNPKNLWGFHVSLTAAELSTASGTWAFEKQVLGWLKELPGIQEASVASSLPLEPSLNFQVMVKSGRRSVPVYIDARSISPDYFRTMGIPILHGRGFTEEDTSSAPPVVVVNQAFARECCRGRDATGNLVELSMFSQPNVWWQIVGVSGDTKEDALNAPSPAMVFIPQAQLEDDLSQAIYLGASSSWVVRSSVPPSLAEIQRAVGAADPGEAVADLEPMGKALDEAVAPNRFESLLMLIFAGISLLLSGVGLYGVTSYLLTERTHEIGIRIALGASPRQVFRMVAGQGFALTLAGVAIGICGALALARFLSSLLYGVTPSDPLTFIAAPLILAAVALVACYVPVRRAMRVDPVVALRHE